MLDGISCLSPGVLLPLAVGAGLCLLILSRGVHAAYRKWYAGISRHDRHCRRNCNHDFTGAQRERCKIALNWVCLAAGAVVSYAAGRACLKLSQR